MAGRCFVLCNNTLNTFFSIAVSASDIRREGRKEMLYLTTHSTHFIHGYMERERNVLFNDALNTFYLRLYGDRHMVKDHSDSERGNPLPLHGLLFPISSNDYFICIIPKNRIAHTTTFVTPVMDHWLE